MKRIGPIRAMCHFSYSSTTIFREHTLDAVYFTFVQNNIPTGGKPE